MRSHETPAAEETAEQPSVTPAQFKLIKEFLGEGKRRFKAGDVVTALDGSLPGRALLVVERREDGQLVVDPKIPNAPPFLLSEKSVADVDDYNAAIDRAQTDARWN